MAVMAWMAVYVGAGAVAGLASGLLGIGGGLVMVPVLLAGFAVAGVPADAIPALALGTSLAAVAVNSALASRAHWRQGTLGAMRLPALRRAGAALLAGVVAGTVLASRLPRPALAAAFALFQVAMGLWMLWRSRAGPQPAAVAAPAALEGRGTVPFMAFAGFVSAVGGIGGASLIVPWLAHRGVGMAQAGALSAFFGCVVGAGGAVGYALLAAPAHPVPHAVGYVSLPAFACLALGSALLVGAGARLARRLSRTVLARAFAAFLLVAGTRGLLAAAGG